MKPLVTFCLDSRIETKQHNTNKLLKIPVKATEYALTEILMYKLLKKHQKPH
uniref:Uncharacterized protein n=1 Tax=Arundo donax TaxID=35708 RepID=A0A0A9E835_ARUDO